MKYTLPILLSASIGVGLAVATVPANPVHAAQCGQLPSVEWWSNSHESVRRIVDKKYGGNWDPYIDQWKKYYSRMQLVKSKGGVAEVKSRGLKLKGLALDKHVADIRQRLDVLQCLKAEAKVKAADTKTAEEKPQVVAPNGVTSLRRFDRPAQVESSNRVGNDGVRGTNGAPAQVAEVTEGDFQLEVSARCDGNTAVFQVTNLGERWPRLGAISLYRTEKKAMLSKRRLRMNNSQQATFKVRKKQNVDVAEVGIWIEPSWFKRDFKYDSKITCK